MKYTIGDKILFNKDGKISEGFLVDERGDCRLITNGFNDHVVFKEDIVGHAHEREKFKEGGLLVEEEVSPLEMIKNMEFYRYYPKTSDPFKISYDGTNKYGFGMYFLDNPDYYRDKFPDGRVTKVKAKVKRPMIFTNHNQMTPCHEYQQYLDEMVSKGQMRDKDEFNRNLLQSGCDSIIVFDPRGIYLILLKDDESLYEVLNDTGDIQMKNGGEFQNGTDEYLMEQIAIVVGNYYPDINGYQGELLYRHFNDDIAGYFKPAEKDLQSVGELVNNGYLIKTYEVVGSAYMLTDKGMDLVNDIVNAVV